MTDKEILALLRKLTTEEKLALRDALIAAVKTPPDSSSSQAEAAESR